MVERGLIGKESQYYIGTYMVMFLMFALALEKGNFKVPFIKPLSFLGENLSTDVYIYHLLLAHWLDLLLENFVSLEIQFISIPRHLLSCWRQLYLPI